MQNNLFLLKAIAIIGLLLGLSACKKNIDIDYTGPIGDWVSYGGTDHAERYSPLTQITAENVQHLEKAWEYHTGDVSNGKGKIASQTAFEATPLLIEQTLYVPTPFNRVIALNPETGEERWTYDPKIDLSQHYANQLICRGVSYWKDSTCDSPPCQEGIFMATNDSRLIALDAKSGLPFEDFGNQGQINLLSGVGEQLWKGEYQVTSPPAIIGDLVVVGSAISDNARIDAPSGVVRAYNAKNGSLIWSWDLSPPADSTKRELISDKGYLLGTPNVWAPMATDEERDLLFVPTGNPSPDYYGGLRNNIDFYGSSIVALKASTGEVVWHFQTVHHDLWDFDVPAQPTLTEITKDGQTIPVVIQATKMGLFFILNRKQANPYFPLKKDPFLKLLFLVSLPPLHNPIL